MLKKAKVKNFPKKVAKQQPMNPHSQIPATLYSSQIREWDFQAINIYK